MNIEKINKIALTQEDKLGMILSNHADIVINGKLCLSIDKWDDVIKDILYIIENDTLRSKK